MSEDIPRQLLLLMRLAQLELDARDAESVEALQFLAVNDTHRVVPYEHAVLWSARRRAIVAVSGALKIERTAPEIVGLGAIIAHLAPKGEPVAIDRDRLSGRISEAAGRFLMGPALLVSLKSGLDRSEGALLLTRREPFTEAETRILARLGSAFGSAFAARRAPAVHGRSLLSRRRLAVAASLLAIALLALPVRLHVLADASVVPIDPIIVAAPLDGVIERLAVEPDRRVSAGDLLFTFDTTDLAAEHDVRDKRVRVLEAEHAAAEQKAFLDERARAELGLTLARLAEGRAELALAATRLRRAEVRASGAGVAVVADRNAWTGRPVRIGERVLSIADTARVRLEIRIAVEDALVIAPGAAVDLFLATDPSTPVPARLSRVSYDAHVLPGGAAVFIGEADLGSGATPLRLGLTGTARIAGDRAPLAYALFRKPLASLRRLLGV
jgi:multidrug efflux pump subunit AcrA (membrane-fusion protein)